jgi:hypothetical protein
MKSEGIGGIEVNSVSSVTRHHGSIDTIKSCQKSVFTCCVVKSYLIRIHCKKKQCPLQAVSYVRLAFDVGGICVR